MTRDQVLDILKQNNISIENEKRLGNNLGTAIKTDVGCILNIFDTGKINFQGKNIDKVEKFFKAARAEASNNKKVFVVYGHDLNARTQLEAMLIKRWKDLEKCLEKVC